MYVVAGARPCTCLSYASVGGDPGTTSVDLAAIHSAGAGGVWNHLDYRPVDGTLLDAAAAKYRVLAGAPHPESTSDAGVVVDPAAIANAGQPGRWSHLAALPVPGAAGRATRSSSTQDPSSRVRG